jgi:hypothetical protein
MHEIDILKYLLLNDKQIYLFNFISKPSVSLLSKHEMSSTMEQKFSTNFTKEEIDKMHESFTDLVKREWKREIDIKLLKMVASEVDHLTYDY